MMIIITKNVNRYGVYSGGRKKVAHEVNTKITNNAMSYRCNKRSDTIKDKIMECTT